MKHSKTLLMAICLTTLFSFDIPDGWFVAGSKPKSYEMGLAKGEGKDGKNCATIQSIEPKIKGFGTLMQNANPAQYLGKRVKLSGWVKTKDVKKGAALWFRVDHKDETGKINMLGFDNMWNRLIKGTTEWTKYELVLDVPKEADNLAYGALLSGTGQIWFDEITLTEVDSTVQSTNRLVRSKK
ncbi:MAG: hypothetical protein MUE96_10010 [Bacteroidia bacterium]|nr:hypothetical protein [Bacteroidia bacterium]